MSSLLCFLVLLFTLKVFTLLSVLLGEIFTIGELDTLILEGISACNSDSPLEIHPLALLIDRPYKNE